jgi:predicted P-loop ATPase
VTEVDAFLSALYQGLEGFVELRPLPEADGAAFKTANLGRRWMPVADAIGAAPKVSAWCAEHGLGAFYGVLPRLQAGSGTKASVGPGQVCWCDLDFKDYEDGEEEARERLTLLRMPPSALVSSGNGLHAYWLLDAVVAPAVIEAANVRLIAATGADEACKDSARVLRLPGSLNVKDPQHPRPVVLDFLDAELRYNLEALVAAADTRIDDLAPAKPEPEPQPARAPQPRGEPGGEVSPADRYVDATLSGVLDDISAAEKGTRNRTVNRGAYALGRLVGGGVYPEQDARRVLTGAALAAGLGAGEAERTITSGLEAGKVKPWEPDPTFKPSAGGVSQGRDKGPGVGRGRPKRKPPAGVELEVWGGLRKRARDEVPLQSLGNASVVLEGDSRWAGRIWFDEMAEQVFVDDQELSDEIERELACWMEAHYNLQIGSNIAHEALCTVAARHKRHPLKERLEEMAEAWDGTPGADSWLSKYLGAPDDDLHAAMGRAWLVAAVARCYIPGAKVDVCPILVGPQGALKSSALRVMAIEDRWFSDSHLDFNYGIADAYQALHSGAWVFEMAELDGMTRAKEMSTVKAFLSSSEDRFRKSYGRNIITRKRRCIITASTNEAGFLRDATGSRRFWPIRVGTIDLAGLKAAVPALWGEAVHWFRGGEVWHLSAEMETKRSALAEAYQVVDPWAEAVLKYGHSQVSPFTVADVLARALDMDLSRAGRMDERRVSAILQEADFIKTRFKYDSAYRRGWRRPNVVELRSEPPEEEVI